MKGLNPGRAALALSLAIALTGCWKRDRPTLVPHLDHVYTVSEFLAQPDVLEKTTSFCDNDPGSTALDPNCINAQRASHIAVAGTGDFPKIVP